MTAIVYLITGQTGAGKTTYAQQIAEAEGGVRFSIDEWMTTLFWMDGPDTVTFDWAIARIERCEVLIRKQAEMFLRRDIAVVLDLGFTKRDHRIAFVDWASRHSDEVRLHWVDVPVEDRWARVRRRNVERGATYAMNVDRSMFDFMEAQWQAPGSDEHVTSFW